MKIEHLLWFREFIWELFFGLLGTMACLIVLGLGIGLSVGLMMYAIQKIAG